MAGLPLLGFAVGAAGLRSRPRTPLPAAILPSNAAIRTAVEEATHDARRRHVQCDELDHRLMAWRACAAGGHVVALEVSGHEAAASPHGVERQGSEVVHHPAVVTLRVEVLSESRSGAGTSKQL